MEYCNNVLAGFVSLRDSLPILFKVVTIAIFELMNEASL